MVVVLQRGDTRVVSLIVRTHTSKDPSTGSDNGIWSTLSNAAGMIADRVHWENGPRRFGDVDSHLLNHEASSAVGS